MEIPEILNTLFDIELSGNGRLVWNKEIDKPYKIIHILKNTNELVNELIGLYISSFDEKKKFINLLGLKSDELNVDFIKATLTGRFYKSYFDKNQSIFICFQYSVINGISLSLKVNSLSKE